MVNEEVVLWLQSFRLVAKDAPFRLQHRQRLASSTRLHDLQVADLDGTKEPIATAVLRVRCQTTKPHNNAEIIKLLKSTWNPKMKVLRWFSFSNRGFSGSMLIFQGVSPICAMVQISWGTKHAMLGNLVTATSLKCLGRSSRVCQVTFKVRALKRVSVVFVHVCSCFFVFHDLTSIGLACPTGITLDPCHRHLSTLPYRRPPSSTASIHSTAIGKRIPTNWSFRPSGVALSAIC